MRSDLKCYKKSICYVTSNTLYLVARRSDNFSFDLLTIDRTAEIETLTMNVRQVADESELYAVIPFAASGSKQGGSAQRRYADSAENPTNEAKLHNMTVHRSFYAYGIVGFVKFLHGYYALIVSEASQVATICHHSVFKIDKVESIYIPIPPAGLNDSNEHRYWKTFQNIDLTNNFYMSYTYDMTRTLQSWLDGPPVVPFGRSYDPKYTWNNYLFAPMAAQLSDEAAQNWILPIVHGYVGQGNVNIFGRHVFITLISRRSRHFAGTRYLKRGISTEGYVANEVETEQIVFENPSLALVDMKAKRDSRKHHSYQLTDGVGHCSSFVQMRGSVPALWTQDFSSMSMVGPPPISVFGYDLGMRLAGQHFSQLLMRYGSPIIVLDLVKTHQKWESKKAAASMNSTLSLNSNSSSSKGNSPYQPQPQQQQQQHISSSEAPKEALLHENFSEITTYLNQFLEPKFRIQYNHLDLAHIYRRDPTGGNTVRRLLDIGERVVASCGICTVYNSHRQKGIVRTNCVDCLDRTNAAQLACGLVALGHQFYSLGITSQPIIELDSYCFRLFEQLFEEMGDFLALQYGSSLLVHHFATYRRTVPWISQSRDKLEQVSRLLNNTFSDSDRQHGKNLLLGIYRPFEHHRGTPTAPGQPLWELLNDYDLHNPPVEAFLPHSLRRKRLVHWIDEKLLSQLPFPAPILDLSETVADARPPECDAYSTYFQPNKITFFDEMHEFKVPDTIKNFTPAGGILLPDVDLDPFVPLVRKVGASSSTTASSTSLLRRFLQYSSGENALPQPPADHTVSINNKSTAADPLPLAVSGGTLSDGESEESAEIDVTCPPAPPSGRASSMAVRSIWPSNAFSKIFPNSCDLFDFDDDLKPNEADTKLFEKYCYMADFEPFAGLMYSPVPFGLMSEPFCSDIDFLNTKVPPESVDIYETYVHSSPGFLNEKDAFWKPEDRSAEYKKLLENQTIL